MPSNAMTSLTAPCIDRTSAARIHYSDVIMSSMASQITSLTIVYSTVYSGVDQRKSQSSAALTLWGEFTGDRRIPRTKGQQCANIYFWWRHRDLALLRDKGNIVSTNNNLILISLDWVRILPLNDSVPAIRRLIISCSKYCLTNTITLHFY